MGNLNKGFIRPRHIRLLDGVFKTSQEVGERYLEALDIDRLLAPCFEAHGLQPKKERYGGWEARSISGHSLGHYMSALAVTYQATGNEALKQTLDYAVSELAGIQAATGSGYIGGLVETPFIDAAKGTKIGGFDINGYWVPWYSVHKIYRGLIDAHVLTDNKEALATVIKFADWAVGGLNQMSEELIAAMLECEHGGMNDIFAQLYGLTGNEAYLRAAVQFTHQTIIEPLEQGVDALQGRHANTQIPKVIGVAEIYKQEPSYDSYRKAASFFWDTVVHRRSYVIGSTSTQEHFEAIDMESPGLKTGESCCTHNMLELSKHVYNWEQNSHFMDYYENALYNHILGTQDPDTGNKTYFTSTLQGHYRIYGTHDTAWWCCTGSGMENPGKYAEAIYYEDKDDLYLNLYMASQLDWQAKGLALRLETNFPYSETATLIIAEGQAEASLKLRVPAWIAGELTAVVNGEQKHAQREAGYLTITRTWSKGDTLEITLPMELRKYTSRDNNCKIAFVYGPLVLGGKFGNDGLPEDTIVDETALNMKTAPVPNLWTDIEDVNEWVTLKDADTLTFEISASVTSDHKPVTLVPFYSIHHEFYNVYWLLNEESDGFENRLNNMTIDSVVPDGQQDEIGHHLQSNCVDGKHNGSFTDNRNKLIMWREAYGADNAYFSYQLAVDGSSQNYLVASFWGGDFKHFHSEGRTYKREFDILIEDVVIGEQSIHLNRIDHAFYVSYPIDKSLTAGKESITVSFRFSWSENDKRYD
jgi:DUF1680 family protein